MWLCQKRCCVRAVFELDACTLPWKSSNILKIFWLMESVKSSVHSRIQVHCTKRGFRSTVNFIHDHVQCIHWSVHGILLSLTGRQEATSTFFLLNPVKVIREASLPAVDGMWGKKQEFASTVAKLTTRAAYTLMIKHLEKVDVAVSDLTSISEIGDFLVFPGITRNWD